MNRVSWIGLGVVLGVGIAAAEEGRRLNELAKFCTYSLGEWLRAWQKP